MQDGVNLRGLDDAGQDRIVLIGADELGPLQRDGRLARVEANDDLHVGIALEGLRQAAAPEGGQPGDEDAPAHGAAG